MANFKLERAVRQAELQPINPITKAINELYPVSRGDHPLNAEEMIQQLVQKKSERRGSLFESPYFPGILFKKTPAHIWMEQEKADRWETVYDYLHRSYRVEQMTPQALGEEWGVRKHAANSLLRSAGVPPLRSSEYQDPHRAATARRWEDQEKRRIMEANLKQAWANSKTERVARTHSETAKVLRKSSIQQTREKNGNGKKQTSFLNMVAEQIGAKEREKIAILGENPKAALHELLEVQGLSYQAVAKALKGKVSVTTIRRWAIEEEIEGRPRTCHGGLKASQYERYESVFAKRDSWELLTDKQREVLGLIKDEKGKYRQNQDIARIVGITSAGVHYIIQRATQRLSELD